MSDPYQPPSGSYPPPGQYPPAAPTGQYPPPGQQYPTYSYGPYGPYPPYPVYPAAPPLSGLAIASFVLSLVWLYGVGSLVGLILGLVALRQIKRTGQRGRGFAIAGVVISAVAIVFLALVLALVLGSHDLNGGTTVEVPGLTT